MASLKTQKKRARIRDKDQCQICGEVLPVPYGRLEVHHIVPRAKGGCDKLKNLVTLCDLCHAILHPHMVPAWIGLSKFPPEEREHKKLILDWARKEFEDFLTGPIENRYHIQDEVWSQWGVIRNK
jgi:5-methylcytosine-specific restriction endonuclease McrA